MVFYTFSVSRSYRDRGVDRECAIYGLDAPVVRATEDCLARKAYRL